MFDNGLILNQIKFFGVCLFLVLKEGWVVPPHG